MAPLPWITVAGGLVGVFFGVFGVGGSSFATPALALLGVHGVVAVASPLPGTIPAALAGAWSYLVKRECDCKVARWSLVGGAPGAVAGAVLSRVVGGRVLLVASGLYSASSACGCCARSATPSGPPGKPVAALGSSSAQHR